MKTKARKRLLTSLLFWGVSLTLYAQSRYEYAFFTASNDPKQAYFYKYIDGKERILINVDRKEASELGMYNLMIRIIKEMEAEGWELFEMKLGPTDEITGITTYAEFFFLFRKKGDK